MIQKPITLSIFFPTFNEEDNITGSIEKAIEVAEHSPYISDYEVIVVNDGSSDRTREIAEAYSAKNPHVRVVTHEKNRGAGAALVTGFTSATKDYVFYTDADLQFDIAELNNLLLHLDAADAVIGYRAPRRDPFMRLVNAKGWNVLVRTFFGLKVRDIDCAFKVFPTASVQRLDLKAEGAMTIAESLIRLSRAGVTFKEVPVTHWPRTAGSPTGAKLSVILRAFKEMMQLYWGDLGLGSQKQALRYIGVGVINTAVDFIVYFALTRGTPFFVDSTTLAKLFSFLAGTVSSFALNRSWTFQLRSKVRLSEVVRFYSVISLSLVVNLAVMAFLTNVLGIYDLVALLITTVFTFAASFTLAKAWVFIKETTPASIGTEVPQL
jgi:glycosyltransferase involved in cell wall biosynthesis